MNNYNLHKHLPLIVISVIDIALPCIVLYCIVSTYTYVRWYSLSVEPVPIYICFLIEIQRDLL